VRACDSFEESLFEPQSASYRKYSSNEILVTFASHRVCVVWTRVFTYTSAGNSTTFANMRQVSCHLFFF